MRNRHFGKDFPISARLSDPIPNDKELSPVPTNAQ
jgi:hypothetical protein